MLNKPLMRPLVNSGYLDTQAVGQFWWGQEFVHNRSVLFSVMLFVLAGLVPTWEKNRSPIIRIMEPTGFTLASCGW